jgi:hypothetical protein
MDATNRQSFKDAAGQEWPVRVNYGTCRLVNDETDIDLLEAARGRMGALQDLVDDPHRLMQVIWTLCSEQARQQDIDEKAFAERFDADAIRDAAEALLYGLISFFPRRVRPQLERALERYQTKLDERMTRELEKTAQEIESPRLEALIDASIDSLFSTSAASSPESSASIPARGPSAS